MTRAELVAWLDRGLTPRPAHLSGAVAIDWWPGWTPSWRDFERDPCVCRGGFNVVECVGGFRMERCARCNAVADTVASTP